METRERGRTLALAAGLLIAAAAVAAPPHRAAAQGARQLPFAVGERLTYTARVAKVGKVGTATMWVEGPVEVRGTATYVLRFDFHARKGPVTAEDHTTSWLDPARMASLQFHKHERHPLSKHDERVEMFPESRRWQGAAGDGGTSPTSAPLDELSFMYFIRTLLLDADSTYRFGRHFDAARNPTTVRVVRRETVATGAGEFRTVLLEMRVKDPRRYRGEGTIRISLTDDTLRLPVRIESRMPVIGTAVLTLDSYAPPPSRSALAHRP
jgi:hypothetical protein